MVETMGYVLKFTLSHGWNHGKWLGICNLLFVISSHG